MEIKCTALTGRDANMYYNRLECCTYYDDISMESTMRAVVYPRIPADEHMYIERRSSVISKQKVESDSHRAIVRGICDYIDDDSESVENTVYIHSLNSGSKENNDAAIDAVQGAFPEVFTGFEEVKRVRAYFSKTLKAVAFVNKARHLSVIFTTRMSVPAWHAIQSAVVNVLPWLFDENRITREEVGILEAIAKNDEDGYKAKIKAIADAIDFRTQRIKSELDGFFERYYQMMKRSYTDDVNRIREEINRINEQINQKYQQIYDLTDKIFSADARIEEGSGMDIAGMFLANKSLYLDNVYDTEITFAVSGYMDMFDEDKAEKSINNEESPIYTYFSSNKAKAKALLKKIFLDQEWRIKTCAAYKFGGRRSVRGINGYSFCDIPDFADCMPNPHVQRYHCLGGYEPLINQYLTRNEYEGAINQTIASAHSINFYDGPVMEVFSQYLARDYADTKCIDTGSGCISVKEALDMM